MNIETTKDIFWLVLAFCLLWLTFFFSWLLYYMIRMLRQTVRIVDRVESVVERVDDFFGLLHKKAEDLSALLPLVAAGGKQLKTFLDRRAEKKSKKQK